MAVFIRIGNFMFNPDAIAIAELKQDTDEVNVTTVAGNVIHMTKTQFQKVYIALNQEGMVKDKT